MLESFGYDKIVYDFATADKIHSLENVMMMMPDLRYHFDALELWLEPVRVSCPFTFARCHRSPADA